MPIEEKQLASKQHAVPQNIMDVEFKLIGDLTMRQFTYLLVFGLTAYFNAQVVIGLFRWPLTLLFALLGVSLAFLTIQERNLDEWIVNFIRAVYSPTQTIWQKKPNIPSAFLQDNLNIVKHELITLAPTSSRRKLEEYLDYQKDKLPKDPLDIPESEFILKVREAFKKKEIQPSVSLKTPVSVQRVEMLKEEIPRAILTEVKEYKKPEVALPGVQLKKEPQAVKYVDLSLQDREKRKIDFREVSKPSVQVPQVVQKTKESLLEEKKMEIKRQEVPAIETKRDQEEKIILPKYLEKKEEVIKEEVTKEKPTVEKKEARIPTQSIDDTMLFTPLTPDRHAGRAFTSFLPSQGEIVLPVRGERVLKTTQEQDIEKRMLEKEQRLQAMLENRRESRIQEIAKKEEKKEKIEEKVPEKKLEKIAEVKETKEEVSPMDYSNLDLRNKPLVADAPNILTGFVGDVKSSPISNMVLIIKNERGEPVRATRTNTLGKFSLTTPLINGKYTVEVSPSDKSNLSFDIISVDARGEIIPPLQIIGK